MGYPAALLEISERINTRWLAISNKKVIACIILEFRPIYLNISRRLSLFGHVARLDHGIPAHDALC